MLRLFSVEAGWPLSVSHKHTPILLFRPIAIFFRDVLRIKLMKSGVPGHPRPWFLTLTVRTFILDDFKSLRGSPDSRPYMSTVDALHALCFNLYSMGSNLLHCEVIKIRHAWIYSRAPELTNCYRFAHFAEAVQEAFPWSLERRASWGVGTMR